MKMISNSLLLDDHPEVYGKQIGKHVSHLCYLILISLPLMELITEYLIIFHNVKMSWLIPIGIFFILMAIWRSDREAKFSKALFFHRELDYYFLSFILVIVYFALMFNWELLTTFSGFLICFGLLFIIYAGRYKIFAIYDDGIYLDNSFKSWNQIKQYHWSNEDKQKIIFPLAGFIFPAEYTLTKEEKQLIQQFFRKHLGTNSKRKE